MQTDITVGLNFAASLFILLTFAFAKNIKRLSLLPNILFVWSVFAVSLNIMLTQSVLRFGFAGKIAEFLGDAATGGSLTVGFIIFIILTAAFAVITLPLYNVIKKSGAYFKKLESKKAEADFLASLNNPMRLVYANILLIIITTVINIIVGGIEPVTVGSAFCLIIPATVVHISIGMAITGLIEKHPWNTRKK